LRWFDFFNLFLKDKRNNMSFFINKLFKLKSFLGLGLLFFSLIMVCAQNYPLKKAVKFSKLIWADEFNVDGAPDSSKWVYDTGTGDWGWGNNEAQYYTNRADNVKVQNGVLKITTIKENYNGSNYTSARIKTQGKFSFKYGKVEMRAKMPVGGGTWPALWMLGDNITSVGWPACGEIDIMEHLGNQNNKIYGTLHHPGHFGGTADSRNVTINNTTTEFHIYALDWRADAIKFYVDNQLFYTFTNTSSLPFNQNFFLTVNSAIGGGFGGVIRVLPHLLLK
jgi:beta-glucanase (GH16 family)